MSHGTGFASLFFHARGAGEPRPRDFGKHGPFTFGPFPQERYAVGGQVRWRQAAAHTQPWQILAVRVPTSPDGSLLYCIASTTNDEKRAWVDAGALLPSTPEEP